MLFCHIILQHICVQKHNWIVNLLHICSLLCKSKPQYICFDMRNLQQHICNCLHVIFQHICVQKHNWIRKLAAYMQSVVQKHGIYAMLTCIHSPNNTASKPSSHFLASGQQATRTLRIYALYLCQPPKSNRSSSMRTTSLQLDNLNPPKLIHVHVSVCMAVYLSLPLPFF